MIKNEIKNERLEAIARILGTLEKASFDAREAIKTAEKHIESGDKKTAIILLKGALWYLYKQTQPFEFIRNHIDRAGVSLNHTQMPKNDNGDHDTAGE